MPEIYNSGKNLVASPTESFISNLSAGTAQVKATNGVLVGLTVNSHTSGAIALYDGTTTISPVMHSTITFGADEREIDFQNERFANGLFVNIGGTADITIRYR